VADERQGPGAESPVLAGGGLLERPAAAGVAVAVVHRTRYRGRDGSPGDWVLPKGKVDPGETVEAAALREVEEETGCRGRIAGPSFPCEYRAGSRAKLVVFFRMDCLAEGPVRDRAEVREVVWLPPQDAVARLSYDSERDVVRRAYPDACGPATIRPSSQ